VTFRNHPLALAIVAVALSLRLIVAPGFMPVAGPDGFRIAICGQPGVTVDLPGKPQMPAMPEKPCAFAGLSTVATFDPGPVAIAMPAVAAIEIAHAPRTTAPHVGVPAPPPFATGPPTLV